jgi:hypothetical protein
MFIDENEAAYLTRVLGDEKKNDWSMFNHSKGRYIFICTYIYKCICIYIYMYTRTYINIHVYAHACAYVNGFTIILCM